jgi:ribose-phosphate pyrophosphokinase
VVRARGLAKRLGVPIAICDKRRERAGESEVMNVIGTVKGMRCILIDDIVDSGGTLCNAATALLKEGAVDVTAYASHGVLSHGALSLIGGSDLKELVVTDTIQATPPVLAHPKVRTVSMARLLAVAIARTARNESVSGLFH